MCYISKHFTSLILFPSRSSLRLQRLCTMCHAVRELLQRSRRSIALGKVRQRRDVVRGELEDGQLGQFLVLRVARHRLPQVLERVAQNMDPRSLPSVRHESSRAAVLPTVGRFGLMFRGRLRPSLARLSSFCTASFLSASSAFPRTQLPWSTNTRLASSRRGTALGISFVHHRLLCTSIHLSRERYFVHSDRRHCTHCSPKS